MTYNNQGLHQEFEGRGARLENREPRLLTPFTVASKLLASQKKGGHGHPIPPPPPVAQALIIEVFVPLTEDLC